MKKFFSELKSQSLFRYMITFSTIIVSIILVMGVYLYQFYYGTIYDDFCSINENYLSTISNRHENDLAVVDDILVQMALSGSNVEFKLKDAPLKSLALEEQLYRYLSVSKFFNQIYFFYHGDQYLYDNATSVEINRFLEEGIILEDAKKEQLYNLLYSKEKGIKVLKEQGIQGYLSKKVNFPSAKGVAYFKVLEPKTTSTLVFIVGEQYYNNLLHNGVEEGRHDFILYENQVVVSRGTQNVDSNELVREIYRTKDHQFQKELSGKRYLVTQFIGTSGLKYCTIQSMKVFQDKILSGQWGILFVLLICSIPASLSIVLLYRWLTRNVKNITALLNGNGDNFKGFDGIERGIRSLVEYNKAMNKESLILCKTRFIRSFVRTEYENKELVILSGKKAELNVDRAYYAIVLIGECGNNVDNRLHEMILTEIAAKSEVDGFGFHVINKKQSLFVVFADFIWDLDDLFNVFFHTGKSICDGFIMSASGYHQDYKEASTAYLEADTAFDNRFLVDNSRIIYFADIAKNEQVKLLPETYLQRLKNAVRRNDVEETQKVIQEICHCLQTSGQSLLTFRILCNDIIQMIIKEWNMKGTRFENIYSVFALSQCLTIQNFNDILLEVCFSLIENNKLVEHKNSEVILKACNYMEDNYHDSELNMSSLADYLNISGTTLAIEFKNAMGTSPSDYLAMIRIEKAKILLKESSLLVKEVSTAVGYIDDIVFTRRFKKYVGKTPGQFRVEN